MGHSVTLGGERVGSGSKSKVYLRNYERSTHNLSYDWLSTMGCGMLIPFMCELVTRDDKYEINLNAGLRTIPTKGPLFGSFKLQLDVYQCPLRLYQALLHNNPLAIGLKANQVKFPKIKLYDSVEAETTKESKSANNSLIKYLGISGMGTLINNENSIMGFSRNFFGAHVLAYYDIFKNYYANKQEDYAYTLSSKTQKTKGKAELDYINTGYYWSGNSAFPEDMYIWVRSKSGTSIVLTNPNITDIVDSEYTTLDFYFKINDNNKELNLDDLLENTISLYYKKDGTGEAVVTSHTLKYFIEHGYIYGVNYNKDSTFNYNLTITIYCQREDNNNDFYLSSIVLKDYFEYTESEEDEIILSPFLLKNIDDMRYEILSFHNMGESFILDGQEGLQNPYMSCIGGESDYNWKNALAGICVKTYQSDIFNNWLNTEIIDGENGIAEITAISTSSGSITIDALQFSEKLYNLLNRIAVSGGTYQDYLDAAYTASAKRFEESPIWIGGMSDEVIFEEIVQTAPAGDTQLGTLGGRGNLLGKRKGGKITVKIDEPSLLIGIVSITPRIVYTQGNKWFNTEIDSLQDIHVPALDAIGFQNLMAETMHFGSSIMEDGQLQERPIIGKIPAWLHYMTNFDQAFGDFAATDGDGYMILNRNYECKDGILQDATTYIDPAKYNYAFAYTKRDAQNFWVKIKCDIKARRLMSAKQIPTA